MLKQVALALLFIGTLVPFATSCGKTEEPTLSEAEKVITTLLPQSATRITPPEPGKKDILLKDLNGDGVSEIVSFYEKKEQPDQIYILIAQKRDTHNWDSVTFSEQGSDLVYGDLQDLTGDGKGNIVLGFQRKQEDKRVLKVFSFQQGKPKADITHHYDLLAVGDLDRDHKNELLLINNRKGSNGNTHLSIRLFDGLQSTDQLDVTGFQGEVATHALIGKIDSKRKGLFVNMIDKSQSGKTTIFTYEKGKLKNLFPPGFPEEEKLLQAYPATVKDVNQDGIVDIPTLIRPPLNEALSLRETVWITQWNRITEDNQFQLVQESVENSLPGLRFVIPDKWNNQVTAMTNPIPYGDSISFVYVGKKSFLPSILILESYPEQHWKQAKKRYKQKNIKHRILGKRKDRVYTVIHPMEQSDVQETIPEEIKDLSLTQSELEEHIQFFSDKEFPATKNQLP